MYALLLPSAQRFISAVPEKVKVELRAIGVDTGAAMPCLGSPLWMARVASPQPCAGFLVIGPPLSPQPNATQRPNWRARDEKAIRLPLPPARPRGRLWLGRIGRA